jgi:chromate reductase
MEQVHVVAFAGSIRKGSHNRILIETSKRLAPEGMTIEHLEIRDFPIYNMDRESDFPAIVTEFKNKIKAADGILMAVPEHNFSFSGVLKNAIDWASRPPMDRVFEGKPIAMQSAAGGWAGGLRAQLHLRQVMAYFPAKVMFFPEICVGQSQKKINENGELTDDMALKNIAKQMAAFKEFILAERHP